MDRPQNAPRTWLPERRDAFLAALRASRSRRDAAERLGVSIKSLDAGGLAYGVRLCDYLDRNAGREPEPVVESSPAVEAPPAPVEWSGARPASTGSGLERRLVISDTHFPFHLLLACAGVIALAKAIQPHLIIHLGDAWNMGAVSKHPRPFGGRENHHGAQVQGLSFFDALGRAAPGARKLVLLGNHDDWAMEFEDEHPEFAGLFAAKWMGLDRLGWELIPRDRQPIVIGPVDYAHGTGGGEHYAKRYALHTGNGIKIHVRGHHHSMQHFRAKNEAECWGAGFLGDRRCSSFDYAKERGHWETGCLVQDVIGSRVTTTPVSLDHGAALFGGRLISQERAA